MNEYALEINNISKTYNFKGREIKALNGLSFSVEDGAIVGLLGPNGAGKTTALKISMDIVQPDSGSVTILGKEWKDKESRRSVGFLPEQPYFNANLSPGQILRYHGKILGITQKETEQRASHLLTLVGLENRGKDTLSTYSKGMMQRFGFALALFSNPELLILDEPSSGLDPIGQIDMRNLIYGIKEQGKTVLLSSHQLSELEMTCDRVVIVDAGRLKIEGRLQDLLISDDRQLVTVDAPFDVEEIRGKGILVEITENTLSMRVRRGDLYRLFRILDEIGLHIVSVDSYRKTLEELFLEEVDHKVK